MAYSTEVETGIIWPVRKKLKKGERKMSVFMNRFTGIGRLTRDPEYTVFDSGKACCKFRLAINKYRKNKDGEYKETASFLNIKTWGRLAEICRDRLAKGLLVLADGEITTYSGEKPDGSSYHGFEVLARDVIFMNKPSALPQVA